MLLHSFLLLFFQQSLTAGGQRKAPQPLGELSMALDEVKSRLAPISVFTVANPKNEFVLVAGEVITVVPVEPSLYGRLDTMDILCRTTHN
jgi:hypothetical protein